jgi:hypothetical protein
VAAQIAIENLITEQYKLRMMGLPMEQTAYLVCDNMSVVMALQLLVGMLDNKYNAIAYHKCQEAVAAGFVRVAYIPSGNKSANALTNPKVPIEVK